MPRAWRLDSPTTYARATRITLEARLRNFGAMCSRSRGVITCSSPRPRRQIIGFVDWDRIYDMHWASSGAAVADLYVAPEFRGLGVALMLIVQMAVDVLAEGGVFLRGGAYDRASTRRFYARAGVISPSGETHLAGRALRHLAQFAGKPVREVMRNLPPVGWNFEV